METQKQRLERIKFMRYGLDREQLNPKEIDTFFNNRFKDWVFKNSDYKEFDFDKKEKGFCSEKDEAGFPLIQKDFIEYELKSLERINPELLNEISVKKYNLYKNILERKKSGTYVTGAFDIPFTNSYAQEVFNRLVTEFGNTKENLVNYSFVYHIMVQKKFIDNHSIKQSEYRKRLEEKNIVIEKIKGKNEIGKKEAKILKYEKVMNSFKTM
jgi:hypothetical protein